MNLSEIKKLEERYYANTFSRLPVALVRGDGMYLYDVDGKEYLDMFAGIAVNALGHAHPAIVDAIKTQAETLIHTSNWFYTVPQLELAALLTKLTGLDKAFLTNDGTGSVETAIKLARKATGKKEIITMKNAFHGRTLGSLSLTWGEKYKKPFEPLVPNVKFVDFNNPDAIKKAIDKDTAAVIVEPIQGEAGVIIPDRSYLASVREITEEKEVLLIVDEVQTGFGRTGKLFAFEHSGISPDILCLGKALGGGFPIGATLFKGMDFDKGEHGGTFIGNPLACAAANATINFILSKNLTGNSEKMGAYLLEKITGMGLDARGMGLMIGINVADAKKTVLDLIDKGILAIYSENTLRILPPLIIEKEHADLFLSAIGGILGD